MSDLRVLVCDDIEARGRETIDEIIKVREKLGKIGVGMQIQELFADNLSAKIKALFAYVARYLPPDGAERSESIDPFNHAEFDCDIIFIDNNLAALDIDGARLTAEAVAGFIRAFTNARYVVSLNKNPEVDFDLRYLVGDYQTQADLALNTNHLSNLALWTGNPMDAKNHFLPWYWPALNCISSKRIGQMEFVIKHMKSAIFRTLSFPDQAVDYLSRHAIGALSSNVVDSTTGDSNDTPVKAITFMDFFRYSCRSLPVLNERRELAEAADAGNDNAVKIVARVVSAEIDKWIRRDVVGPQEVLVDIPHVLMRMPFVLGSGVCDIDRWDQALTVVEPPFGLDREIYDKHIVDTVFPHSIWMKSPCFWWPELKSSEELNDLFFATGEEWPEVVFCEDTSQFRNLTPDGENSEPMEFAAEFEGSWNRRNVSVLPDLKYTPRSRFAR